MLTTIANSGYGNTNEQLKSILWLALIAILIYTAGNSKKRWASNIRAFALTFLILTFVASLVGLISYYSSWQTIVRNPDGTHYIQGFFNKRLFGIYVDPNFGAMYAVLSLVISILLTYFFEVNSLLYIGVTLNSIVQYLYISLTYSRTGVILFLFTAIYVIIGNSLKNHMKNRHGFNLKQFVISILLLIAALGSSFLLWDPPWTKENITQAPKIALAQSDTIVEKENNGVNEEIPKLKQNFITHDEINDVDKEIVKVEQGDNKYGVLVREDSNISLEIRITLAKEAWQMWLKAPILGHGDRNLQQSAELYLPSSLMSSGTTPHNSFLYLLISAGAVAFIIVLIWLLIVFVNWLKS